MNAQRLPQVVLLCAICSSALAQSPSMDSELSTLTDKLANQIKEHGKKKIAVLDFTDLQGGASELGRYIAEQLTVDFVIGKRDFSILDRANLKSILAEHKLTATGIINPDDAKKLGQFAGVDALILGTLVPINQNIELTAKVITTDTAEVVGAARSRLKVDDSLQQLLSHPAADQKGVVGTRTDEKPKVSKTFGDLGVELQSLQIVNGSQYLLTMIVTNQNPMKPIWVALNETRGYGVKGHITDPSGFESPIAEEDLSGIQKGTEFLAYGNGSGFGTLEELQNPHHRFQPSLHLKPGAFGTATVKFRRSASKLPEPGRCTISIEFLLGHDFFPGGGTVSIENLIAKMEAQ